MSQQSTTADLVELVRLLGEAAKRCARAPSLQGTPSPRDREPWSGGRRADLRRRRHR
jgi:hypothetical protein